MRLSSPDVYRIYHSKCKPCRVHAEMPDLVVLAELLHCLSPALSFGGQCCDEPVGQAQLQLAPL